MAPMDPCASALPAAIGTLPRFPPATIVTSEFDYLRLQGKQFAARLEVLGLPTRIIRYAGCDHGFLELLGSRPQAEDLCLDLVRELRKLARGPNSRIAALWQHVGGQTSPRQRLAGAEPDASGSKASASGKVAGKQGQNRTKRCSSHHEANRVFPAQRHRTEPFTERESLLSVFPNSSSIP